MNPSKSLLAIRLAAFAVSIAMATVLTGCFMPASHKSSTAFIQHIETFNTTKTNDCAMTDLPGRHGWDVLDSLMSDTPEKRAEKTVAYNAKVKTDFLDKMTAHFNPEEAGAHAEFQSALVAATPRFLYEEHPANHFSEKLKHKWALQNFVKAAMSTNDSARVNPLEIYGLSAELFNWMVRSNLLETTSSTEKLDFWTILKGYFIAYDQGQFVLRDGTTLSKPTVTITNGSGTFTATIPDATAAGVATVFMEAVCDFGFGTPVFFDTTKTDSYTAVYVSASSVYKGAETNLDQFVRAGVTTNLALSNALVQVYTTKSTTQTNYYLNSKMPTAAAFLPCIKLVAKDSDKCSLHGGLTAQELQFIHSVAGLTESESKELAGILIRSFGSVGAGAGHIGIGSFHLALGDNQLLAEIVEDLSSSFSYHVTEHELTRAFWKYPGGDPAVDDILKDYQKLIALVKQTTNTSSP